MSSNNTIQRAKFINAKPVYFPPMENKWSNDDYGNGSYKSSVLHDKDGSVGGVPNSFIVINGGIAIDEACEIKPTWNAAACKGKDFPVTGATNVRAGTEYKVTTERPSLSLSVTELDAGSWVMFELPGFTTAASGTAQDSLDALRKANTTSYYKGNGSLWVKL